MVGDAMETDTGLNQGWGLRKAFQGSRLKAELKRNPS